MSDEPLTFGRARYFCPVCILRRIGFLGGPSGYVEIPAEDLDAGPLIIEAMRTGNPPLHAVRDMLDRAENRDSI